MSTVKEEILNERIGLTKKPSMPLIFGKANFTFMIVGLALIAVGVMLMSGGQSDVGTFQKEKVYSTTRIVVAPLLITLGLLVEIYALMRKNNN